jgi:hypothetical protein
MPTDSDPPSGALQQPVTTVVDVPHAPFVYFEEAPNFGNNSGIINVSLATYRHMRGAAAVVSDLVVVAHLRCSIPGALALRRALDDALLLGAPAADGGQKN